MHRLSIYVAMSSDSRARNTKDSGVKRHFYTVVHEGYTYTRSKQILELRYQARDFTVTLSNGLSVNKRC